MLFVTVHEDQMSEPTDSKKAILSLRSDLVPMSLVVLLYASGCGSERLFCAMQVIKTYYIGYQGLR